MRGLVGVAAWVWGACSGAGPDGAGDGAEGTGDSGAPELETTVLRAFVPGDCTSRAPVTPDEGEIGFWAAQLLPVEQAFRPLEVRYTMYIRRKVGVLKYNAEMRHQLALWTRSSTDRPETEPAWSVLEVLPPIGNLPQTPVPGTKETTTVTIPTDVSSLELVVPAGEVLAVGLRMAGQVANEGGELQGDVTAYGSCEALGSPTSGYWSQSTEPPFFWADHPTLEVEVFGQLVPE